MNKDPKTVKTEKGFFESIIAPIIAGIIFIFVILYKVAEFVMKYVVILAIPGSVVLIMVSIYLKQYEGIFGALCILITSLLLYFVFFRKSKKG